MSARDKAIAALVEALHVEPADAGAIVDYIVTAAAIEANMRVTEALVEPLATAIRKHADGVTALLARAHRDLMTGGNDNG